MAEEAGVRVAGRKCNFYTHLSVHTPGSHQKPPWGLPVELVIVQVLRPPLIFLLQHPFSMGISQAPVSVFVPQLLLPTLLFAFSNPVCGLLGRWGLGCGHLLTSSVQGADSPGRTTRRSPCSGPHRRARASLWRNLMFGF